MKPWTQSLAALAFRSSAGEAISGELFDLLDAKISLTSDGNPIPSSSSSSSSSS